MYSHRRCQNRSPGESRAGALGAPPPWGLGYKSGEKLARLMSKEISGDPKLYAESFERAREAFPPVCDNRFVLKALGR